MVSLTRDFRSWWDRLGSYCRRVVRFLTRDAWCSIPYFHKVVSIDNSTSAQYLTLTIQAGSASETRHAFVLKDPELFQYDADGNLIQDGRWSYEWNGKNRLIRMTIRSDVPGPHYQLTFQYDWMGRRIRKTVIDTSFGGQEFDECLKENL